MTRRLFIALLAVVGFPCNAGYAEEPQRHPARSVPETDPTLHSEDAELRALALAYAAFVDVDLPADTDAALLVLTETQAAALDSLVQAANEIEQTGASPAAATALWIEGNAHLAYAEQGLRLGPTPDMDPAMQAIFQEVLFDAVYPGFSHIATKPVRASFASSSIIRRARFTRERDTFSTGCEHQGVWARTRPGSSLPGRPGERLPEGVRTNGAGFPKNGLLTPSGHS